eukprot:303516_1
MHHHIGSILWLKKAGSKHALDRVVRVDATMDQEVHILPFMQGVHPKYYVRHIQWNEEAWSNKEALADGTELTDGGAGWVSDNQTELIAADGGITSALQTELFISQRKV